MEYLLTFLEGVITFVSPCLLPLLPVYVAYFAGDAASEGDSSGRTFVNAIGFVAGFSAVFTLLGAFAGVAGSLLIQHRVALNAACGIVMIVLGLSYAGLVHLPGLDRTLRSHPSVRPTGFARSLLFGMVFAVGWSPCVGTFLASALSLAASSASVGSGVVLLLCFSVGLGLPFVLSAMLVGQLERAFAWVKRHYRTINVACGILLVCAGVLTATGLMGSWLQILSRL